MEFTSFSSTTTHYYSYSSSPTLSFSLFSLSSHNSELPSTSTSSSSSSTSQFQKNLRRPKTLKTPISKPSVPPPKPTSNNPLKSLRISQNTPHRNLTNKLRLTSKISPPPQDDVVFGGLIDNAEEQEEDDGDEEEEERVSSEKVEFRQEGKIFVGNLPLWIKKPEITEFFRQFGPIKNVILIKGHEDVERNMGFGFVIYGGAAAEKSASKAVEFDGVEFHGRVLTVKLDDGRRLKAVAEERKRWVEGGDGREYRTEWHEERDGSRMEFRTVLDSQPENWQAVVRAFERVKKV